MEFSTILLAFLLVGKPLCLLAMLLCGDSGGRRRTQGTRRRPARRTPRRRY